MKEELRYHHIGEIIAINGQFFRVIYRNKKTGDNIAAPLTETEYQELVGWCDGDDRQGAHIAQSFVSND